jgi:hypothetical protein
MTRNQDIYTHSTASSALAPGARVWRGGIAGGLIFLPLLFDRASACIAEGALLVDDPMRLYWA